jgi:hypothetical protein
VEGIHLALEFCKQINEPLGSIKGMECFIQLSDHQVSKTSVPYIVVASQETEASSLALTDVK